MTTRVNESRRLGTAEIEVQRCPCHDFRSVQDIRRALDSEERTSVLAEWLSSSSSKGARLSCQNSSDPRVCLHRVSSAFIILNAIRDACRHHLESATPMDKADQQKNVVAETYDEAFPSLSGRPSTSSAPTLLVGKKKDKSAGLNNESSRKEKTKSKRRIRPAPTSESSVSATSVWSSSLSTQNASKGNISALPSENPLDLRAGASQTLMGVPKEKQTTSSKKALKRIAPTPLTPTHATIAKVENAWSVVSNGHESISKPSYNGLSSQQHNGDRNASPSLAHPAPITSKPKNAWSSASTTNGNMPKQTFKDPHYPQVNKGRSDIEESLVVAAASIQNADSVQGKGNGEEPVPQELNGIEGTPPVTPTKNNGKRDQRPMEKQLNNLVQVYATILERHLVPSTALELHLLIRLLTVEEGSTIPANDDKPCSFSSMFPTGNECKTFAIIVLQRMKGVLTNLGFDLVNALAECPPFREMLPEMAKDLQSVAESMRHKALVLGVDNVSSSVGNAQTPMLTLPFNQERDSRHNYRSREAAGMYKNREESRDAFLYQLRAFQNVRERVLDAVHADRSLQKIRLSSRDVVQGISPDNMFWFAQMFCDLLLQIGLVPMEETDKEILNIADKDRLQKLHRRFSSKQGKTNKSSQKLSLETKNSNGIGEISSAAQPQHLFPGHQEFFFIFMQAADSYSFGVQLQRRLAGTLSELAVAGGTKRLEQRLLKMQLLARFLGALVFSPNWYSIRQGSQGISPSSNDAISILSLVQPVLPFRHYVETAWKERRLVEVIPWVVEFLRMLRWDTLSQSTSYHRQLFGLLSAIQEVHDDEESETFTVARSNSQLVSFYLESLFCNVVGFGKRSMLPDVNLPERTTSVPTSGTDDDHVDTYLLVFGKGLLLASNSHVDELFALTSALKESSLRKTVADVGTPRKLRPHMLSSPSSGISSLSFSESYKSEMSGVADSAVAKLTFDNTTSSGEVGSVAIQRKLADAFFHQHKDLKELCDIAVDRSLKNLQLLLPERCIIPTIEKGFSTSNLTSTPPSKEAEAFLKALDRVAEDALVESRKFLRATLEDTIRATLALLVPPTVQRRVIEVATSLAVSHAVRLGETVILLLVRDEIKKKRVSQENIENNKPDSFEGENEAHERTPLETAIDALDSLAGALIDHHGSNVEGNNLLRFAKDAKGSLISLVAWKESGEKGERNDSLQSIFTKLDSCGPCIVIHLESYAEEDFTLAFELIELAVLLSRARLCHRVVRNIASFFCRADELEKLVAIIFESKNSQTITESRGQLLLDAVKAKIVDPTLLRRAMINALGESHGELVAKLWQQLPALADSVTVDKI